MSNTLTPALRSFSAFQSFSLNSTQSSSTQVQANAQALNVTHSEASAFQLSYQADSFAPGAGGCVPTQAPQCGNGGELDQYQQLFDSISQMLDQCVQFLSSLTGGQCQPELPSNNCPPSSPSGPDCSPTSPSPSGPNCPPSSEQSGKMWDVFFDSKTGTKTTQKSPIVLDLNGNGKADITGSNIKGNGKLEGKTVNGFDLDPSNRQWENKSRMRRPGRGAPELPPGTRVEVFNAQGQKVKSMDASKLGKALAKGKATGGDLGLGLKNGMRAEFRDPSGKLVGELKTDPAKKELMYFYGNKNQNEWTKPWDSKTGGDGLLAWDQDGDGKITSGKELFGHVDSDGTNKYSNGYDKLRANFDKDGDGVIRGEELKGLKVWEDRNGDGTTQKGELVDLASRGIRELNTRFNASDMSSSYKHG
jgi:hypothetical protein